VARAVVRTAFRVGFPAQSALRNCHSNSGAPVVRASPVVRALAAERLRSAGQVPDYQSHEGAFPASEAGGVPGPAPPARQDRAAPAEPADSEGVPDRFCLSIQKYWVLVWSVFSCCLQYLRCTTGIPHHPRPLQMVCTSSQTVVNHKRQTSGERFSNERDFDRLQFGSR
jgi:hypothetical protein